MRGFSTKKNPSIAPGPFGVAALCACRADRELCGRRAAIVVCGGNLPFDLLQKLVGG